MEDFEFPINFNPEVEYKYNDLVQSFGEDLHEEVKSDTHNPTTQRWTVALSGRVEKVAQALEFVENHGGSTRFRWTSPEGEPLIVRCVESSASFDTPLTASLSLVLEQVFVP